MKKQLSSHLLTAATGVALLAAPLGCRTPLMHQRTADRTAERLLTNTRQEAGVGPERVPLITPGEALRRRLIISGNLPHSSAASLGLNDLPDSEYWRKSRHIGRHDEQPGIESAGPVSAHAQGPVGIDLVDALQIYARNSRNYQEEKEALYRAALDLDLEADEFRTSFAGMMSVLLDSRCNDDERATGTETGFGASFTRKFRTGAELAGAVTLDLVSMLTQDKASSWGILADASITIPLLRGAGWRVTTANLTQAQRDLLYAVYDFEEAKRGFAVEVAEGFYAVLEARNSLKNAEENYRRLISSTRRARRLADSGRLPEFQYDQAIQDELKSRNRWVSAQQSYQASLEGFRLLLGLPPDASLSPSADEIATLLSSLPMQREENDGGPGTEAVPQDDDDIQLVPPGSGDQGRLEMKPQDAIEIALQHRLDIREALGRVEDAQRDVYLACDQLRPEVTIFGSASSGGSRSVSSADSDDEWPKPHRGSYSALLTLDLPLERTEERVAYRKALFDLNQAVRDLQELEDRLKQSVAERLRNLLEAREGVKIQRQAMTLAEKRVRSTDLFLQAGRAEIRDLLDAEEDLLNARNSLASAMVDYRIAELALQRDLGVLQVTAEGVVTEFKP